MTSLDARAIVDRMFAVEMAFLTSNEKDIRQLAKAFADDVVVREPASLPYGGDWRGLDGIARLFDRMNDVWSNMDLKELHVTGAPDRIHLSCTLTMVARSTGKSITQPFCEFLHFRDGRLAEGIPFYYDTKELLDIMA
ncbi:ketosteroid isomerase-like protein [Rhizobium petrolearium]|uniref:nuclear transport factor 2 family protein n=1 Tax=Neorhizobium petrolearium TaxID=515361 RepID=UPI001AE3E125|nr:nuclear transport factor 2 family protein [Neorhizobium petrolearium]MBP1848238.1 ketosteroid isomerase-like protein [Neorhizobium petrolearium]